MRGSKRALLLRVEANGEIHYLSDASFEAVGGYCVERKVSWRCHLPEELTAE